MRNCGRLDPYQVFKYGSDPPDRSRDAGRHTVHPIPAEWIEDAHGPDAGKLVVASRVVGD
jgi:hypothetical protein